MLITAGIARYHQQYKGQHKEWGHHLGSAGSAHINRLNAAESNSFCLNGCQPKKQ
jgi:hypothetical protein